MLFDGQFLLFPNSQFNETKKKVLIYFSQQQTAEKKVM